MRSDFPNDSRLSQMWLAGVMITEISEQLNMSEPTIRRHVKRLSLPSRSISVPLSDEDKQRMLNLSAEGLGVTRIGKIIGRTHSFVSNWLGKLTPPEMPADILAAVPAREGQAVPPSSPGRIMTRSRQVEWLGRNPVKRRSISIGPPPTKCQFPHGERPYSFCLEPVEQGRPYCAEHTSRCYEKARPIKLVPPPTKEVQWLAKW